MQVGAVQRNSFRPRGTLPGEVLCNCRVDGLKGGCDGSLGRECLAGWRRRIEVVEVIAEKLRLQWKGTES